MIHPKKEQTLVIVKPDGVQRSLVGEIIKRIERVGLKIVALKMLVPTSEQCWKHYNKDDAWFLKKGNNTIENRTKLGLPIEKESIEYGKDIIRALEKYITSGPVVAFIVEGNSSVSIVKKLVGSTEPSTSDVGTIRGDFTVDSYYMCDIDARAIRNLVHCTDNPMETDYEIPIWFKPEELISYRLVQEEILYDVNLDGILE
jgi:nucleoside-diphosphate kinase